MSQLPQPNAPNRRIFGVSEEFLKIGAFAILVTLIAELLLGLNVYHYQVSSLARISLFTLFIC